MAQAAQRQIPNGAVHLSHQFDLTPGWSVAREIEQHALNIGRSIGQSGRHTECISRFTIRVSPGSRGLPGFALEPCDAPGVSPNPLRLKQDRSMYRIVL
jgi:hypothetical protein